MMHDFSQILDFCFVLCVCFVFLFLFLIIIYLLKFFYVPFGSFSASQVSRSAFTKGFPVFSASAMTSPSKNSFIPLHCSTQVFKQDIAVARTVGYGSRMLNKG